MGKLAAALAVVMLAIVICGSAQQKAPSPPTFYKDVLPILQDHCQNCHRSGEVAPMPLETYEQTRPWAPALAHAVEMKMMPPWFADPGYGHFSNDTALTEKQIATIVAWASQGAPAGNQHDAPPPRQWTRGWNIPPPDVVVKMPKPVKIPAQGEVEYTYEIVPTHFAEDRWVQMSEFRAGKPRARAPRSRLHSSAGFALAAPRARRRAVHGVDIDRSPRSPRSPRNYQRSPARLRPGKFPRSMARRNGKVRSGRIRPRLPDALHHKRHAPTTIRPASAWFSPRRRRSNA